jgi:hypothetical protein
VKVNGVCQIDIDFGDISRKPVLTLSFPSGEIVKVTANIAEMIGGAGRGATANWEDRFTTKGSPQ